MASTYCERDLRKAHEASLLEALPLRALRHLARVGQALLRISRWERIDSAIGRRFEDLRGSAALLRIRERANGLREDSEAWSLFFFLALILATFLI